MDPGRNSKRKLPVQHAACVFPRLLTKGWSEAVAKVTLVAWVARLVNEE